MTTIIAGSRGITDATVLHSTIKESGFDITAVISGGCKNSPDELGENWARSKNVNLYIFKADWNSLGKKAGMVRNCEMAENADALIAIWDGKSKGTKHMIDTAKRNGLKVFVKQV